MWFRNLTVYRLPVGWNVPAAELESALARRVLQACAPFEMRSIGWGHAGPSQRFVHTVQGQHLIALARDEKILPAAVIRQHLQDRAAAVADEQGFPVSRRQMRELKESITQELLARALTKRSGTHAWIDPAHRWLVVDTSSPARAEEVVSALRDALGTFAVTPFECEKSTVLCMAAWLRDGDAPLRFSIDQDLELQATNKSKVKYSHHELGGKEILEHLQAGKFATQLGLTWNDRVAFKLTEKLQLKRIEFLDIAQEADKDRDPLEQFDIDCALMTGEIGQLLTELEAALGGRPEGETQQAEQAKPAESHNKSPEPEEEPLYETAKGIVNEASHVGISMLQRRLGIGYNRTARMLEQMEVDGLLGPLQPDGKRLVIAAHASAP